MRTRMQPNRVKFAAALARATGHNRYDFLTTQKGMFSMLGLSQEQVARLREQMGIPVFHEMAGVGEDLHDHLQIRMQYKVHGVKTLNTMVNSLWGKAAMGLEYLLFRTGPLTMPPSQLGAFARSDPSQPTPNIEWHVQPLSLDKFGDPLHPFPAITPSVCNLRPTSRGWVRIVSPAPGWAYSPRQPTSFITRTPWASIWYDAPCTPCTFIDAMPSTTKPMWLTDE